MADFAKTLSPDIPPILKDLTIGGLSPQLQKMVIDLDIGEKTTPLAFNEGMVVFMLCDKKLPELDLPDLKEIEKAELEKLPFYDQWPVPTQASKTSLYHL